MDCELLTVNRDVTNTQIKDPNFAVDYICPHCTKPYRSEFPPDEIHRMCGESAPYTPTRYSPWCRARCWLYAWFLPRRLSTYARAMLRWQRAGCPVRSAERIDEILTTFCEPCDYYDPAGRCIMCGCNLNRKTGGIFNKVYWATESCPLDPPKWLAELMPAWWRRLWNRVHSIFQVINQRGRR